MAAATIHSLTARFDGRPAVPPLSERELADLARREEETPQPGATSAARRLVNNILDWLKANRLGDFGYEDLARRVDPAAPGVGWGVVFHHAVPGEIRAEVERLMDFRGGYPLEEWGPDDTLLSWLEKHGIDPLNRDVTSRLPYYILLAGRPEGIPFHDQVELSRLRAVGRLDLGSDPLATRAYVETVIASQDRLCPGPRLLLASAGPAGNEAARLAAEHLIPRLASLAGAARPQDAPAVLNEATPSTLKTALVRGGCAPALACLAAAGLIFPINHRQQREEQGSWVGSEVSGAPLPRPAYLAAGEVGDDFSAPGAILLSVASFSAGTPQKSEFAKYYNAYHTGRKLEEDLARQPFSAALPQRLLAHRQGGAPEGRPAGALAFVGFMDGSWISSAGGALRDTLTQAYAEFLQRLLEGETVGMASASLLGLIQACNEALAGYKDKLGRLKMDYAETIGALWITRAHARGFVILGDPAVRCAGPGSTQAESPASLA